MQIGSPLWRKGARYCALESGIVFNWRHCKERLSQRRSFSSDSQTTQITVSPPKDYTNSQSLLASLVFFVSSITMSTISHMEVICLVFTGFQGCSKCLRKTIPSYTFTVTTGIHFFYNPRLLLLLLLFMI